MKLCVEELDNFLESLTIYFPDDDIKREDWIELWGDERTSVYAIKENGVIKGSIAIYN